MSTNTTDLPAVPALSLTGRLVIVVVAFLGWMCAGMHMSITQLTGQAASIDLLDRSGALDAVRFQSFNKMAPARNDTKPRGPGLSESDASQLKLWKVQIERWYAWYTCAFLFGAAAGGLFFGWLGDRIGRAKGMAASILTYSSLAGAAYLTQSPWQLLMVWFLACMGVGGMWPNGVALIAEAWTGMSRPMVAGVIGTSANVGILLLATVAAKIPITPDHWRWIMLVGALPFLVGLFALFAVPESPRWLAARGEKSTRSPGSTPPRPTPVGEVFRPPLLRITLVGIALATIPIMGGWGSANWMIPWAGDAGEAASPSDPYLKARVGQARAVTGIVGSLLGGWIASLAGRRRTYFLVSLFALGIAQYVFWRLIPTDRWFLMWVAALGFFSGIYFGWLPLCLPELFPTRSRSTGAGVSFNFGRILTAITVFATGALTHVFGGDYARIGKVTSLIFALGMLIIWLAPDTSQSDLED